MNRNTELLIEIKEQGIWGKVKSFFKRLFYKPNEVENISVKIDDTSKRQVSKKVEKSMNFIQGQDVELLELQKKYKEGEIKEANMTEEQIKSLCDLYDKQISELRASNEARKQRLLKYREKMNMTNI